MSIIKMKLVEFQLE